MMKNDYYVYVYSHPATRQPFYVGKGRESRALARMAFEDAENEKQKEIAEILKQGRKSIIEIVQWNLTQDQAFAAEAALIQFYRPGMSRFERYDAIRGNLKDLRESVKICRLALVVYKQFVWDVYQDLDVVPAGSQGSCCITGINDARLLVARHIRPWSKCLDSDVFTPDGVNTSLSRKDVENER